jgi:hypothetical protein
MHWWPLSQLWLKRAASKHDRKTSNLTGRSISEYPGAVGTAQQRAELSTSAVSRPRPPSRWLRSAGEKWFYQP